MTYMDGDMHKDMQELYNDRKLLGKKKKIVSKKFTKPMSYDEYEQDFLKGG